MRSNMKRRERQKGSAIVEGAFIFLVFACMIIGSVDFGQFLFIHTTLTERAREAARYGAVNTPTDATAIQNVVLYGQASGGSVPTTAAGTDSGIFNVTRNNVSATTSGSGTDDYRITVKIHDYTYHIYSPYMAGSYAGPIIYSSQPLGINP
jgi:Flp pilus assembly protein TadG